ncbi:MAG: hypothetical protein RLZZ628_1547 [Bacteroidota bacterium]|jgi:hypothetical protein
MCILKNSLFILMVVSAFWGCSNEFDLIDTPKEIPVIYGMLNLSDTATYIRVERAFADAKKSGIELAKDTNALFYKDVVVKIVKVATGESFVLQKVDGNKEGYPRKDGLFVTAPNYLYKIKHTVLNPKADMKVRLEVRQAEKILTQATTQFIGSYEILDGFPNFDAPYVPISAQSTLIIGLRSGETAAKFYDIRVHLNYDEIELNGNRVAKTLVWDYKTRLLRTSNGGQPSIAMYPERAGMDMFRYMSDVLPVISGARYFKDFDIALNAGGAELLDFQNIALANTGITASQELPTYSNFSNGAYGLLTARHQTIRRGYKLSDAASNFLKEGDLTRKLNFR